MSSFDRVQPNIVLTSPDGNIFTAKWIGNQRSREKKIGLFTYPDVAGTISQDLNVDSTKYPLTIYFDGTDHDLIAERFFKATAQIGLWKVEHPVKGTLNLQLLSVSEQIQPVENGNVTIFNTDFIEPADDSIIKSGSQLKNGILSAITDANANVLQQFVDQVSLVVGNARTAVNNATKKINTAIDSVLRPLAQLDNDVNSAFNSITRGIDNTINKAVLAPGVLAGQIINIIQLPAKITVSSTQKLATYGSLVGAVLGVTGDDKYTFAVKDLALSAVVGSLANIGGTTDAKTRTEIIDQIEAISLLFDNIVNGLDNDMSSVVTDKIENQYISMEGSFPQNLLQSALAIDYLLKTSFDLSIEKRFKLREDRLPIMITIAEYGSDEFLDFFNETNKLDGEDFILLSAGREVVVFPGVVL